jgi:hypothetical protein
MRSIIVALVFVLLLGASACSSGSAGEADSLSDAEIAWCGDPNDFAAYDAIWEAADAIGVDSMGDFMLAEAGIETDIDPKDLAALSDSLSREQINALADVGKRFDESDDLWLEYLATPDGIAACSAAYEANH